MSDLILPLLQGNGVHMVAAHTDSPCFKLKPKSKLQQNGFVQVRARIYVLTAVAIDQHRRNVQLPGGLKWLS
jgi:hypothetical protein